MFAGIARFEIRYQLRQPVFWVVALIFFLLTFGSITIDQIQLGGGGNVHRNSPFAMAQTHLILSIFYMFVTTAFVANIVVRDDDTGFGPIIRATPIGKFDYLFGRFAGAFALAALCLMTVPLAIAVGSLMPWVDPETLGPMRLQDYGFAYFVLALPDAWFTATLFFAVATITRSMLWTYVSVLGLLIIYVLSKVLLDRPELAHLVALVEPFGLAAFDLVTQYWTAAERNGLLPALQGVMLWNRVLWIAAGAAFLYAAYALFRFEARPIGSSRAARGEVGAIAKPGQTDRPRLPQPRREGWRSAMTQLLGRTRFELAQVLNSPAFIVLLALGVLNAVGNLWYAADDVYGSEIYPVTRMMIQALRESFNLVPIIVAIYYAGELVWRDRERRMHEIIDATPASDWTFVVPKALAVALALFAVLVASVLAALVVQAGKGYTNFEIDKFLGWYVLPFGLDWSLLAVLAVFLQAIAPHKLVGWGLMVLYLIFALVARDIGFDHNLYIYGGYPNVPLSDMNGAGDFGRAAAWFRAYWSAFAVILLVLAHGLWRRGSEQPLKARLKRLPHRLAGPAGIVALAALATFAGVGGYIFVNTNVLNEYRSGPANDRYAAEYEKALLPFVNVPQPSVKDVTLELDLDPHAPRLVTRGSYVLENRIGAPLDQVHVSWDRDLEMSQLTVEGAQPQRSLERFNYRIYRFDRPLSPGERRSLRFVSVREQRGFKNSDNTTRLVDNGTFLENAEFAPIIGASERNFLRDRAKRRKYDLLPERRMARIEDQHARGRNYIHADLVNSDITVTTVSDQTPIAPGYKVSDVTRNGRRTARFVSDAPIVHFFSVQSARYAVKSVHHQGVELVVYYDRQHPWNVDRMISSLETGLDYFQASFGPYQFRQVRILEFPAYDEYAQAFASTIPYSEGLGFIANFANPDKIDYVTYVTAHELGHQWWAHQVVAADSQGATVLSETLAQYSALMVMEKTYGPDKIRQFLKYELDSYLSARGKEGIEELPLMRVENQGYIHYRKGSLVMYLLKDRLGEDAVNKALRGLIERYAFKGPPYPTSKELIAALRAEAAVHQQQLITDLFERITLYDLQCSMAHAKRRPDGRYDVSITVQAHKRYADGAGQEMEAPLDESFDIGLFTAEPGRGNFDASNVMLLERRPLRSGAQTLTFVVDQLPTFAGVDPYNKWIDRNSNDNLLRVGLH